jgi:POT family proton-dependent oligopeptide transporter
MDPYTVPPDQVQTLNPLCVLLFVPLFSWIFGKVDPENKVFRPIRRMLMGFGLTVLAISNMAFAGYLAQVTGRNVSIFYLALSYVHLTAGEVLVYGTGLELAYTAAPKSMKSFITACFLLTDALGNFVNILFGRCYGLSTVASENKWFALTPGNFFMLTACMVALAGVAFYFVGKQFDRKNRPATPALEG